MPMKEENAKIDKMIKSVKEKMHEVDELSEHLADKRSALIDAVEVVNSLLVRLIGTDEAFSVDCLPDYDDQEIRDYIHTADKWLGQLMSAAIEAVAKLNTEQNEINEKLNNLVLSFNCITTEAYTSDETDPPVNIIKNTQFGDLIDINWIPCVKPGKYFVTESGVILFKSTDSNEYTPIISSHTAWGSEIVTMCNRVMEKTPIIVEAFFPQYRNKPFTVGFKDGNNSNFRKENIVVHVIEY